MPRSNWRLLAALLAVLGLVAAAEFLPIGAYLGDFLGALPRFGIWGPVLLATVYVLAAVLMIPGTILSLGAGFAFGLLVGTVTVSAGSVLGAVAAFLVGRTAARGLVERRVRGNPRFAALDRAVDRNGFKIVLLSRLSPVFPYNLLNYLFSLTSVRTWDFCLASWIGMLPGTILYVYLGTTAKNVAELLSGKVTGGVGQRLLFVVGLLATVLVTVLVTQMARRALREYMPPEAENSPADD